MKKLIILLLTVVLCLTMTVPAFAAFTDVPTTAYYSGAVQWALDSGVTSGTSATTFTPNSSVTRGQAVTFLWRAKGCPEPNTKTSVFTDVQDPNAYYYKAVLWATENGITSGTSATTFAPNGNVTRGQMIVFLYRTMGEPGKTGTGAWNADAENWAKKEKLLDGTAKAYATNGACPRSDVVFYLWRELDEAGRKYQAAAQQQQQQQQNQNQNQQQQNQNQQQQQNQQPTPGPMMSARQCMEEFLGKIEAYGWSRDQLMIKSEDSDHITWGAIYRKGDLCLQIIGANNHATPMGYSHLPSSQDWLIGVYGGETYESGGLAEELLSAASRY